MNKGYTGTNFKKPRTEAHSSNICKFARFAHQNKESPAFPGLSKPPIHADLPQHKTR